MLWTEHVNIGHLGSSKCYIVYCEVKCPFWLPRHFTSKLGKLFHLTLLNNAFFQLSFFLRAPNFLALVTTLENLGARGSLPKKLISCPVSELYLWEVVGIERAKKCNSVRKTFLKLRIEEPTANYLMNGCVHWYSMWCHFFGSLLTDDNQVYTKT